MKKIKLKLFLLSASCLGLVYRSYTQSPVTKSVQNNVKVVCNNCAKSSCNKECLSPMDATASITDSSQLKALLPSCSLSAAALSRRKEFLQASIASKIADVEELETGYGLIFNQPNEYATTLLEFINVERNCCSSFSYALIFEPNNKTTHLHIYGSEEIKIELSKGFKALGLLK